MCDDAPPIAPPTAAVSIYRIDSCSRGGPVSGYPPGTVGLAVIVTLIAMMLIADRRERDDASQQQYAVVV